MRLRLRFEKFFLGKKLIKLSGKTKSYADTSFCEWKKLFCGKTKKKFKIRKKNFFHSIFFFEFVYAPFMP